MSSAPGADLSFDNLFPPEGVDPSAPPQAVAPETAPPAPPQAPEQQPFLKAGNSVYLTHEEAAKGLEYKDQLVHRYRTFLKENGFDPNTFKKVAEPQAPAPPQQNQSPYTYYGNGNKVYEDFAKAVANKDPRGYEAVLNRYTQEAIDAQLSPYAPLLAEVADQRARRQVKEQVPDFETFISSPDHAEVMNRVPLLKQAIENAQRTPQAADHLAQLYQIEYLINRGIKAGSPAPQQATAAPTVRTTTPTATMTPPTPTNYKPAEWATNREARKQLIQDRKAQGIEDVDWGRLGL